MSKDRRSIMNFKPLPILLCIMPLYMHASSDAPNKGALEFRQLEANRSLDSVIMAPVYFELGEAYRMQAEAATDDIERMEAQESAYRAYCCAANGNNISVMHYARARIMECYLWTGILKNYPRAIKAANHLLLQRDDSSAYWLAKMRLGQMKLIGQGHAFDFVTAKKGASMLKQVVRQSQSAYARKLACIYLHFLNNGMSGVNDMIGEIPDVLTFGGPTSAELLLLAASGLVCGLIPDASGPAALVEACNLLKKYANENMTASGSMLTKSMYLMSTYMAVKRQRKLNSGFKNAVTTVYGSLKQLLNLFSTKPIEGLEAELKSQLFNSRELKKLHTDLIAQDAVMAVRYVQLQMMLDDLSPMDIEILVFMRDVVRKQPLEIRARMFFLFLTPLLSKDFEFGHEAVLNLVQEEHAPITREIVDSALEAVRNQSVPPTLRAMIGCQLALLLFHPDMAMELIYSDNQAQAIGILNDLLATDLTNGNSIADFPTESINSVKGLIYFAFPSLEHIDAPETTLAEALTALRDYMQAHI